MKQPTSDLTEAPPAAQAPSRSAPSNVPLRPPGTEALDAEKARGLRRMKAVALGFLIGATVIFLVMSWGQSLGWGPWAGYVRAAAEAGMIGALADWFAVTALFRHPMGIKIPHTAILPTRKDTFGASLSDFISVNFLSEDVVRDKVRRAELASAVGGWLSQPENAEKVTSEAANVLSGAMTVLRDDDVQAVLQQAVMRRVLDNEWAPKVGGVLEQVFDDGAHHKLVDLMCDRSYEWVRDNHSTVLRVVSDRAPSWSPKFVDEMLADKVYGEVLAFAWAVKVDVNHPMRMAMDRFLAEFANDLQFDRKTIDRAEQIKTAAAGHPEVQKIIGSAWGAAKEMLIAAAEDPDSELRTRLRDGLVSFGRKLNSDDPLRHKVETWVEDAAAHIATNYAKEITTLISDTVERWDAVETSRKVELQVGRDLQFIRINGTVVGALAGLVIYTVAQVLF